jgi:hypothetical protein
LSSGEAPKRLGFRKIVSVRRVRVISRAFCKPRAPGGVFPGRNGGNASLRRVAMTEALEASRESERLKRYRAFVRQKREQARAGEFSLAPDSLWLSITENCNFRCVGCYTEGLFKKGLISVRTNSAEC